MLVLAQNGFCDAIDHQKEQFPLDQEFLRLCQWDKWAVMKPA